MKVWINAKKNMATELAIKENEKKAKLTNEEPVPVNLHEFLDIFDENKANQFPESNVWDHKIDMKEGFEPKAFKNYNLIPEEQKELDKFLDENFGKRIYSTISVPYGPSCYKLFSSSTCIGHAFYSSFLFMNYTHFPQG